MKCKKCGFEANSIQSLRAHQKRHKDQQQSGKRTGVNRQTPGNFRQSAGIFPGRSENPASVAGDPRDAGRMRKAAAQGFSVDVERINSEAEAARAKAKKIEAEMDLREAEKKRERILAKEEQQEQQPEYIVDNSGETSALQAVVLKLLEKDGQAKAPSALEILSAVAALVPKTDALDLIKKLQELTPKAGVDFESFLKGIEFARENLPRDGEKQGFWSDVLAKALDRLPAAIPAIMGGMAAMKKGASPSAVITESAKAAVISGAAASTAEQQAEKMLPSILADLKQRARARKDPELLADFIAEECVDIPQYQSLVSVLLGHPLEYFGQVDPDILTPLYSSWFGDLYRRLQENFKPQQPGTGSGEKPENIGAGG